MLTAKQPVRWLVSILNSNKSYVWWEASWREDGVLILIGWLVVWLAAPFGWVVWWW
jgi:hypothetical protein